MANVVAKMVGNAYLSFFERHSSNVKRRFGQQPASWPSAWRMGWLLRNAVAHNGRFAINDANFPITTWNGITVSCSDNNAPWFDIKKYFGGGDVLALIDELHRSIR